MGPLIRQANWNSLSPTAGQAGLLLSPGAFEALPSFRDVPSSEKQNPSLRKLNMCFVVFDFNEPSKNIKEKDVKRQTLLELADHVSSATSKFNQVPVEEITKMVALNLFRTFRLSIMVINLEDIFDPEEEPSLEPAWPHIRRVY